ncbi:MAG: TGS domain-containing protein, partial [Planctomycetota bacterium]|nr:TGS domain-containing protein [Planctomycetota bacterium]
MSVSSDVEIKITLPDGSERVYAAGTTGADIAASIGKGLAKAALAIRVNDVPLDLSTSIDADASVAVVTRDSAEGLTMLRHSGAHIMADAVKRMRPDAKLWKGPAVDDERYGFYYDIDFGDKPITDDDLPKIEKLMAEIVAEDSPFERVVVDKPEALRIARDLE